jgi:hypothetical protein
MIQPDPSLPDVSMPVDDSAFADDASDVGATLAANRLTFGLQGRSALNLTAAPYVYDGHKARAYAYRYVGNCRWPKDPQTCGPDGGYNNKQYITQVTADQSGEDCANFVSQALHAGGMSMTRPISAETAGNPYNSWWADKNITSDGIAGASYAWKNATGFLTVLRDRTSPGRFQQVWPQKGATRVQAAHPLKYMSPAVRSKIKVGDVLQFDLRGDYGGGDTIHPDHTTLITQTPSYGGQFTLTMHTYNHLNFPLWLWMHDWGPATKYVWIFHVRHSWSGSVS